MKARERSGADSESLADYSRARNAKDAKIQSLFFFFAVFTCFARVLPIWFARRFVPKSHLTTKHRKGAKFRKNSHC